MCTFGWPPELKRGHGDGVGRYNNRRSLSARINRPWHQNKCRILSRKYSGGCIKAFAKQTFQQDSAPSHSTRATQEWLQNQVPRLIFSAQWPPKSPDTNPLDY